MVMPRRTAIQIQEDQAIADLTITVSPKLREQIITMLLSGDMHDEISKKLKVTLPQVAEVADTIKGKLRDAERKKVDECRTLLLNGSIKAFKELIRRLDDPDFPTKMLPATAGVLFDKYFMMAGSSGLSQTLVVSGTANMDDAINRAMVTLTRISGSPEIIETFTDDEGENEE
jgi:hypothetical protein